MEKCDADLVDSIIDKGLDKTEELLNVQLNLFRLQPSYRLKVFSKCYMQELQYISSVKTSIKLKNSLMSVN
jgi:hypothetical protein